MACDPERTRHTYFLKRQLISLNFPTFWYCIALRLFCTFQATSLVSVAREKLFLNVGNSFYIIVFL